MLGMGTAEEVVDSRLEGHGFRISVPRLPKAKLPAIRTASGRIWRAFEPAAKCFFDRDIPDSLLA